MCSISCLGADPIRKRDRGTEGSASPAIIAHEIIGDIRTGRCLLLIATGHRFGPVLPEGKADELRTIAQRQPWFREQTGGANVNIETELLPWL